MQLAPDCNVRDLLLSLGWAACPHPAWRAAILAAHKSEHRSSHRLRPIRPSAPRHRAIGSVPYGHQGILPPLSLIKSPFFATKAAYLDIMAAYSSNGKGRKEQRMKRYIKELVAKPRKTARRQIPGRPSPGGFGRAALRRGRWVGQ